MLQFSCYWEVPKEPWNRNSKQYDRANASNEDEARKLVENSPAGFGWVEVTHMPPGDMAWKLYKDSVHDDWRVEYPTDKQTHQKVDTAEYE